MSAVPHIFRYDRPEGCDPEVHPEVLARRYLTSISGIPEVNYDNLAVLFQHELLDFPADDMPVTSLYYRTVHPNQSLRPTDPGAWRLAGSRVLHINAFDKDERSTGEIDSDVLMERLIRRAAVYSLARGGKLPGFELSEHSKLAVSVVTGGLAVVGFALGGPEEAAVPGGAATFSALALRSSRLQHFNKMVEPTVRELLPLHRDDIVFPNRAS